MDVRRTLKVDGKEYDYFSLKELEKTLDRDLSSFPYSLKVLLENLIRNNDGTTVTDDDVNTFASWTKNHVPEQEINFYPSRVVMQDFTGIPAVVDLAAMRDAIIRAGGDSNKINPMIPVDLVIDHSVMVDYYGSPDSFLKNVAKEFERNTERYRFLKWGQEAFENFRVVPPGTGIFPVDDELLHYLRFTGRDEETVRLVEKYTKEQGMWRDLSWKPRFNDTLKLDLSDVEPSVAGPSKPQDRVLLSRVNKAFETALDDNYQVKDSGKDIKVKGKDYSLKHGDVVIAAITSCTNTSNPDVLIAAGLVAKKARELGLTVKPWVKTSLAPGSKVVTEYLNKSGLSLDLDALGFNLVGYGCTTCIGNSGPLPEHIREAIKSGDLVTCNILSGNRNFEGRISPESKASYLASPPLVVAYAIAGSMRINLTEDPIGQDKNGKDVYLKDIWPGKAEIKKTVEKNLDAGMFKTRYADVFSGTKEWQEIKMAKTETYDWEKSSTYIKAPPFFQGFSPEPSALEEIRGARCLAILPDSTTTDHISPAGFIPSTGPAGKYLLSKGVEPAFFNSFGSRRGNHEVMMRGTFANIRIKNRMVPGVEGGFTKMPDGRTIPIYDAAMNYAENKIPLLVFAGKEYGTGSSRDWAAKGTYLLGVKAVIAESYERIHRSNLIGMGVLPLEFEKGTTAGSLNLSGRETFDIPGISALKPQGTVKLTVHRDDGSKETVPLRARIDTEGEFEYYRHNGILGCVLRQLSA